MARPIDPKVTRYVRLTDENADEYRQLEENRFGVQVAFAILFVGMALVVLLSAIWIGLGFADRLVEPIRQLISAAGEISAGNLDVQVPARRSTGDLALLAETFNTMSSQLKTQRNELLSTNDELTERRRFIEAMLSGVSAGVIGLDADNKITLANRSAIEALGLSDADISGKSIQTVLPDISELVDQAGQSWRSESRGQIRFMREGDQRTLNVQITRESAAGGGDGLVVTLDDITDLVGAQRRSAWADVARRIAHEIKNPLTPIQLSAERLRRRYTPKIPDDDRKVFDQCTETIVRQVGDIRRMVDEFSSFARMPKPVMEVRDLADVVKEAVFLQEVGNPDIHFKLDLPDTPARAPVDHRLVTQAMTNIVK
ncbi:MAG: sensor histidine kinase, partial [Alphaproteobacteria bacterium]